MGKMEKRTKWCHEHINWCCWGHVFAGLGVAWLISLAWHYSLVALVLGIVFLVAWLVVFMISLFAKQ